MNAVNEEIKEIEFGFDQQIQNKDQQFGDRRANLTGKLDGRIDSIDEQKKELPQLAARSQI